MSYRKGLVAAVFVVGALALTTSPAPAGTFKTIAIGSYAQAFGINDRGDVVVGYFGAGFKGFLLSGGIFTTIDVPGSAETNAWGINGRGQIVGEYEDAGRTHGFLLDHGIFTTIDAPFAGFGPIGINARGDIASGSFPQGYFVLHQGIFTTIDVPFSTYGPIGINARGDIVGTYQLPSGNFRGFVLSHAD